MRSRPTGQARAEHTGTWRDRRCFWPRNHDRSSCYTNPMTFTPPLPIATAVLSSAIALLGFLAVLAWITWRFGPTLARITGWCSWWVAWACGSEGGYGYCVAFLLFGALAWGSGTIWYARRCGHWPSRISRRLFERPRRRRSA